MTPAQILKKAERVAELEEELRGVQVRAIVQKGKFYYAVWPDFGPEEWLSREAALQWLANTK